MPVAPEVRGSSQDANLAKLAALLAFPTPYLVTAPEMARVPPTSWPYQEGENKSVVEHRVPCQAQGDTSPEPPRKDLLFKSTPRSQ